MPESEARIDREKFFAEATAVMRELKPDAPWEDLRPDTHLWAEGYLDSVGMLEVIYFLEEQLGRPIELLGDFLPNFFTLQAIYDAYAAPVAATTDQG
jgi:acyl carrier protein